MSGSAASSASPWPPDSPIVVTPHTAVATLPHTQSADEKPGRLARLPSITACGHAAIDGHTARCLAPRHTLPCPCPPQRDGTLPPPYASSA